MSRDSLIWLRDGRCSGRLRSVAADITGAIPVGIGMHFFYCAAFDIALGIHAVFVVVVFIWIPFIRIIMPGCRGSVFQFICDKLFGIGIFKPLSTIVTDVVFLVSVVITVRSPGGNMT